MLDAGLNPLLTYHNREHTEDVLQQAVRIAVSENIQDPRSLLLIKIAALFHDTGFLDTYKAHEERSCEIMLELLDTSQFDPAEITIINGMIMATKIPQSPVTLSEKVICDADLDYLGRDDFPLISNRLKVEFLAYHIIKDEMEWDRLQVNFLEKHNYFTATSAHDRRLLKKHYLEMLKQHLLKQKS